MIPPRYELTARKDGRTPWKDRDHRKEGALKKGLPEARAVPNDREGVPQKGVLLFFLW
jgi:hypothetical protein